MEAMISFISILHVIVALLLILLILIQDSKGGGVGGMMGGGNATSVLGAANADNIVTKATKWLAFVFAVTCVALAFFMTHN
jgi:preprotein translocase subunit SecG